MMYRQNPIWEFFSSVHFALLLIPLLIAASITGTLIPQEQPLDFYIEKYGQSNAVIMDIMGFSTMYSSLLFRTLLLLLCLNLIVCSLERIPQVLQVIKKDNLSMEVEKLMRNRGTMLFAAKTDKQTVATAVCRVLHKKKWLPRSRNDEDLIQLFAEKGAWSRLGAYVVHGSILIIVFGALVGSYYGLKAFVFVMEGDRISQVDLSDEQQSASPLPFTLQCDAFDIEYYPNGMPKEYRSDLVILEKEKEIAKKRITVNDPLNYLGFTFFQASYRPISDQYVVALKKTKTDKKSNVISERSRSFYVQSKTKQTWNEEQIHFKIIETGADGHGHGPYKIWFDDETGEPVQLVVDDKQSLTIQRGAESYEIIIKQRYATGLQVVKDPGIWFVYFGFVLMLAGLYVAFFMSHRRLWISIQENRGTTSATSTIILRGSTNKNQAEFSKTLDDIVTALLNEKTAEMRRI